MGLGQAPFGIGLCGFDPVSPASPAPSYQGPRAVFIDTATRDAVLLSDGTFQAVHPVDQAVLIALTINLGTLGSVPTEGQGFTAIAYSTADITARVSDAVRVALKTITDRGDATVLGIRVQRIPFGWVSEVTYRNNVLGEEFTTPPLSIG
jgi:hypothetical protein